ncbi:hypothetical protein [uncultured Planktomarina sp.]|jgi:hypothetical protein|uniref:hypothetical protein n=1 Tax=uncultured Planktomarina sp. TaxID=1538529 RepID=UPI003261BB12|tara:strand:+ start:506 stop:670 length:165 start_codon:yes stop_codon:yes gene_type:complete
MSANNCKASILLLFSAKTVDFEALGGLMMNEDQFQWDKDNGVEYAAYTMQPMGA